MSKVKKESWISRHITKVAMLMVVLLIATIIVPGAMNVMESKESGSFMENQAADVVQSISASSEISIPLILLLVLFVIVIVVYVSMRSLGAGID